MENIWNGEWMHDEITWINNARYFIHTLSAKNDRENRRRRRTATTIHPRVATSRAMYLWKFNFFAEGVEERRFSRHTQGNGTPRSRHPRPPPDSPPHASSISACTRKSGDRRPGWLRCRSTIDFRGAGWRNNETADSSPPPSPCSRYPRAWNFIVETLAEFVPPFRSLINECGWKVFKVLSSCENILAAFALQYF